jgi:arsenite-transporting ATPase
VFYGGKGGVGKTTCASAYALAASGRDRLRVLLVSTDPAHSLGDALGVKLSGTPARIGPLLDAVELDATRAFARWLDEHRRALGDVLEHGTWLDAEDVDSLLDLAIPGVDELVGLLEIERMANRPSSSRSGRGYDLVVTDTAPTGHTLRLLAAPETVAAVAEVFDTLQQEHRLIRRQLARVNRPEAADLLIAQLTEQAHNTAKRLRDPGQTALHWVTLAEALSLAETEDAVRMLDEAGLRVTDIIVNRVTKVSDECRLCERRREEERSVIAGLRRRLGRGRRVRLISAATREPVGVAALTALADGAAKRRNDTAAPDDSPARDRGSAFSAARGAALSGPPERSHSDQPESPRFDADVFRGASLLFFGGKGGVGKTTVAAATAVKLAQGRPAQRFLLLSTDPAHSLLDVFGERAGPIDPDQPHTVTGAPANLYVRELDAPRALEVRRASLESALDDIAVAVGTLGEMGGGIADNAALHSLMRLAPPGIDELFGILAVIDARAAYDVVLVDTAPTGHALRLLEMPDAAREWTQLLLRMLMKYRALVRPGRLAAELVDLSRSIRELQAVLRDHACSRFILVTRAAELARVETTRLLTRLRRLSLAVPAIVVNARTLAPERCRRCRATADDEEREVERLVGKLGRSGRGQERCAIIQAPISAPPPRGAKALGRWADRWIFADGN